MCHTHTLSSFTKRRAARLANRNIPYNRFRPEEASRRLYLADRPAVFTLEICMDGMRWFKNKAHLAGGERYDCPWPVESPFGWTQTRARVPSRSKSRSIRFKNEWKGRGRGKKKNGNETNGPLDQGWSIPRAFAGSTIALTFDIERSVQIPMYQRVAMLFTCKRTRKLYQ